MATQSCHGKRRTEERWDAPRSLRSGLLGLDYPSSDFPIGGRHQRIHASRSSASGGVEKVDNSGTDVVVIFGNGCHPRHRDSFVLMADTVRALSHFHERRMK